MAGPGLSSIVYDMLASLPDSVKALVVGGAAGAYVRAVREPNKLIWRRATDGFAGAVSAVFLGGLLGHMLNSVTGAGVYAYCAAAFVMGEGGIVAVRAVRRRILKDDE